MGGAQRPLNRTERRRQARAASGSPLDLAWLRARVAAARVSDAPPGAVERARGLMLVYLDTAMAQEAPVKAVLSALASGEAAVRIGAIEDQQQRAAAPERFAGMACGDGCAFCCILTDDQDGGAITEHEAEALHAALAPYAGAPDGRGWHLKACPALDPETRSCRAYEARPMICRAFQSTDAEACRRNAEGEEVEGASVVGSHITYLAARSLARAALTGRVKVATYRLVDVAAGAVEGKPNKVALRAARRKG